MGMSFVRHRDDDSYDEVFFVPGEKTYDNYDDVVKHSLARVRSVERYKQSYLSGDEWRFSTVFQLFNAEENSWSDSFGGGSDIVTNLGFLYSDVNKAYDAEISEFSSVFTKEFQAIYFMRKGILLKTYLHRHPIPFLGLVGHGVAAYYQEDYSDRWLDYEAHFKTLCCQPTCKEKWTVLYKLKKRFYGPCGNEQYANLDKEDYRAFCERHKTRGDCGLEDSDDNCEEVHDTEN